MKTTKSKDLKPISKVPRRGAIYQRLKKDAQETWRAVPDFIKERYPDGETVIPLTISSALAARLSNCAMVNGKSPGEYIVQAITTLVEGDEGTVAINPSNPQDAVHDERQFKRLKKEGFILLGDFHKQCGLIEPFSPAV